MNWKLQTDYFSNIPAVQPQRLTAFFVSNYNKHNLINLTINEINQNFSVTISEDMKDHPKPYRIPKMHKSLIGTRFIIASKQCTIKP